MVFTLLLIFAILAPAQATRLKDVAAFYGYRDNQLTGAGLVVGLQRSGDSTRNEAAVRALSTRLQGLGVSLQLGDIKSRNVALVMVSATMPAGVRTGSKLDVTVASTGDATSLEGGVLLLTPLMGADGHVYAAAEGPLVVGGFAVAGQGNATLKGKPTVGRVVSGALVEREVPSAVNWNEKQTIDLVLHQPDFTTAARVAEAVNTAFGDPIAEPVTAGTITLTLPADQVGHFPAFAAQVESIEVLVDAPTRVVVNERTGTVVMGASVKISAVAIAHGGLTIEVKRRTNVSQPQLLSAGNTEKYSNSELEVREKDGQLVMVEGVTVGALISALDALGVNPRDLISILQALHAAGALHAEIVTL